MEEEGFTYNPAPRISSVRPDAVGLEGGKPIVIIGKAFIPRVGYHWVKVLIGDAEARNIVVMSPTEIIAITPPSTPGVKDVEVINRDGQKDTEKDAFTYNPMPGITRVIPNNGRLAGGTQITVQGNGFLPGAKVLIRINEQTYRVASGIQVMSPSIIMALTPPAKPGPKRVAVRNPDGQIIALDEGFTYNHIPTITRVDPNHGPASGGAKVIIEGTGFLHGARAFIGGRPCTTMVMNDESLEAVAPPNPQGVYDVRVMNPDGQLVAIPRAFISVGEVVYNYPNPFLAAEGTTFRYVTKDPVHSVTVKIFNMRGYPIGAVRGTGSNEVRWHNPDVYAGLYIYVLEARMADGKMRAFRNLLEVYK